ncbi:hypothetical protein ABTX86_25995, partial [Streptomyces anulatus]|uniref:hypothetical protein n=1 Tax=Streptomyces anulatus TaxID=1892 RepID=UPI00331D0357
MRAEHVVRRVVVAGQQPAAVRAVQGRCGAGALAVSGTLSPPNFSATASARTRATMASATMPAAGT